MRCGPSSPRQSSLSPLALPPNPTQTSTTHFHRDYSPPPTPHRPPPAIPQPTIPHPTHPEQIDGRCAVVCAWVLRGGLARLGRVHITLPPPPCTRAHAINTECCLVSGPSSAGPLLYPLSLSLQPPAYCLSSSVSSSSPPPLPPTDKS